MQTYNEPGPINVGAGHDIEIKELAHLIKEITGFQGTIQHDLSKPDGTPRKLMDVSRLTKAGWSATIRLEEGICRVYESLEGEEWY
jgi:GDP-L-fucose synthase